MKEIKKEALYYKHHGDDRIICELCPHMCSISLDELGKCRVRKYEEGKLITLNYGKIASYGKDPIEKKPLYHFYPGESIFFYRQFWVLILHAIFCQNYSISQEHPSVIDTPASNIADIALNEKNNIGVAYTYNEPTIWYEFMYDIAKLVHKAGKKNVIVTNGFINPKPLDAMLPIVDAMNIDLKSMNPDFYKSYCGGRLDPVLETIQRASKKTHVELTTLLIEGLNTKVEEIEKLAQWIASIDENIPLHLSRYFPNYKRQDPATDVNLILELSTVAKKYLNHVYIGNLWEVDRNTYCPNCNAILIDRSTLVKKKLTEEGKCLSCGYQSNIIIK